MALEVANTIRAQLGNGAFVMMGAKNLVGSENSLRWKVGRNAKRVSLVEVELAPDDTYTVRFYRVRGFDCNLLSEVEMVYADSLKRVIESNTGLYLSL